MGEVVDAPNAKELISWINTGRNHAIWLFREHCSPEDVKNLATALKNSKTCTKLGLGFNSIAIDGAKLIANSLLTNNTLILLYLYGNDIEDDGAIALASMLKTNKTLKDLNVENNKIGIPGASAIGEALTVNKTLTWLSLESNKIMDAGAISICDALTVNNSLKYLSLSAAEIGDPTAESLGNALANNKSLRSLRIVNNRITHEGAKSIEHGMERNGSLHFLRISANNDIPQNYIDKLERLAEKENLRGFLHALQTTESAPWQRSKLMVVGEGRAGKTATVRSLLNEQFDPEWDSTIGVALTETKVDGSGKFENAGEESYLTDLAHRIAVGEYLNQDNEQEEMPMLQIPASNLVAAQEPIIEVETPKTKAEPVANKRKSEKRKSLKKEAPTSQFAPAPVKQAPQSQAIEQEFDHVFEYDEKLLLDAKKNKDAVRLSIWDYGGQEVFQTLHHLFLTQYGEYLLVFDMSLALKQFEMSMEYLKFWLSSIKIHANEAPVILVGTFLDSVNKRDNLNTLDKKIRENLKELLGQAVIYEASNLIFFPISNKSGDGIPDLKSSIKVTVESQPHVLREVSLKWMRSLDQLVQDKETNSYTKFSNFREMAKDVGIDTLNEVESMLALFHEMGIIFYFRETETLRDQIITNPQWLIDMISKVIRDSKIHPFANDEIKAKGLDGDVKLLFEQGLASRDLLEYLWTKDQADYLVDLMRHLLLLSEWKFGNTEVQYFVPAMIVQKTLKEDKITPALVCKMEFEILPTGAFERLVCLLVAYGMEETDAKPPELAKEAARIYLKDKDMITIKHKKSKGVIKGSFTNIQRAGRNLDILERMLRKIKDELMGEGFSWRTLVKFDKTDNKFKSLSHVKDKKLLPEGGQNDGRDLDFGSFLETF